MADRLIQIQNVKKVFNAVKGAGGKKTAVHAVDDVSFDINELESISLVGESGCGKSTLARLVMRLYDVTDGVIKFKGKEITSFDAKELRKYRQSVQMVFQDPYSSLDPRFTVKNILREGLSINSTASPASYRGLIIEMLRSVDLPIDILNRYPHEFSGGERQRIAIARALVAQPRILILDEAVSSLDVLVQQQIIELLQRLKDRYQLSYLFISHNIKAVKKISDRILVMYQGRLVEYAPSQELLSNPQHPYTRRLLKAALDYKYDERMDVELSPSQTLQEVTQGHWILQ